MSSLRSSEWFIVYFFLILLASLVVIARISHRKVEKILEETVPFRVRQIEISGEVARPGVYEFRENATLGEVLKKAHPKRFADLSELDSKSIAPLVIEVPRLKFLRITISGSGVKGVQNLLVEPGARVSDLKLKLDLHEDADLTVFHSRKMLSDGEEIWVEKRK